MDKGATRELLPSNGLKVGRVGVLATWLSPDSLDPAPSGLLDDRQFLTHT